MDKIPLTTFMGILEYVYDFSETETYIKIISHFAFHSKTLFKWTLGSRYFLESFYFSMFPPVKIPSNANHVFDGDTKECRIMCGKKKLRSWRTVNLDEKGWHRNHWTSSKSNYRCKVKEHYDHIQKRSTKTRFKDIKSRCRDKYIAITIKRLGSLFNYERENFYFYERMERWKAEHEKNVKQSRKVRKLCQLRDEYNHQKKKKKAIDLSKD